MKNRRKAAWRRRTSSARRSGLRKAAKAAGSASCEAALERSGALAMGGGEHFEHRAAGTAATARGPAGRSGRPAGDEALAVEREAAAGHDHMHMRMMGQGRAPSVQHRGDADPGAKMLGIGGNGEHGLGRRLEQKAVDFRLVLLGDGADRGRQREHHMVVGYRQKLGLAFGKPLARRRALDTSGNAGCGRSCSR